MVHYCWDLLKNERLKAERDLSFEQVVLHIAQGDLLGVYEHPNKERYPNQQILVVRIGQRACLVPFVTSEEGLFLKTIIPSRKATREYLGETDEKAETG